MLSETDVCLKQMDIRCVFCGYQMDIKWILNLMDTRCILDRCNIYYDGTGNCLKQMDIRWTFDGYEVDIRQILGGY